MRDVRLPLLLDRIRQHGSKTFLLTNSEYEYTNVRTPPPLAARARVE